MCSLIPIVRQPHTAGKSLGPSEGEVMLVRQHLAMAPYNNSYSMVPVLPPTSRSERFCRVQLVVSRGDRVPQLPPHAVTNFVRGGSAACCARFA